MKPVPGSPTRAGIKRLLLKNDVIIQGRSYWGRRTWMRFSPHPDGLPGWYWRPTPGAKAVPVTSKLVRAKLRRMEISHQGKSFQIWEHIGALRWTGLDSVIVESERPHPPYHGRPHEKWLQLKLHCQETDEFIPWVTVKEPVRFVDPENVSRVVKIDPLKDERTLRAYISIDYPGLTPHKMTFELPGNPLEPLFEWQTQGFPLWLYGVSKAASHIRLWHSHHKIEWVQEAPSREEGVRRWTVHRFIDILGALSLVSHEGLFAGHVFSHKGGHGTDVGLLQKIRKVGVTPLS